ncbi:glycosyltransferase [Roseibacillus ishigakijimensis]|uniref:Glycosyltransferase n=1 Tax=Roseibacillus ishigakijimensis TaxID=454146 RepID=A0A934RR72_9BACT|nr:glycosyltransferase [Roseibacillus ishigakijimensis]MBK1832770.1 glycosyltransferase [Roseibacillus ishigakijimensis]
MKAALVHYHLRTGGVSKVVANQSQALSSLGISHRVLSAGPAPKALPHLTLPELDYQSEPAPDSSPLFPRLRAAFAREMGGEPDLWHLHNATLGKHAGFPGLIRDLAHSGTPFILQLHDFAEDNRPHNYPLLTGEHLYPLAPQIHYAFINSRDQRFLKQAGLPESQSHLLPNAVVADSAPALSEGNTPALVLYPVRGIRRKNLGEMVLLAALAPPGTRFAISLAPENPRWQAEHDRWVAFAKENHLPVLFDVTDRLPPRPGKESNFATWVSHATHLVTTSIAEGFGLAYLEPALRGKPLFGRDLPEITSDFRTHGIEPGRFYQHLPIPLSALDHSALKAQLQSRLQENYQNYNFPLSDEDLTAAWAHLTSGNEVDFGALPEDHQETVIQQVLKGQAPYLDSLRQWLAATLAQEQPTATPAQVEAYSLPRSQEQLASLYHTALTAPRQAPRWLPKEAVLGQFLSPTRFHFLRD